MKITKLILSMLTISTLMNFTACKDDDDDDVEIDEIEIDAFAKEIPVNFTGHTEAKFAYVADGLNNNGASATVSVVNDSTVSVKFSSTTWGEAEFSNVVVKKSSDGYTLSDITGTFNMGMPGSEKKDYPAVLSGNVKSADDFAITITLQVMGGTTIKFLPGLVETESEISPNRGNNNSEQNTIDGEYYGYSDASATYFKNMYTEGDKISITLNDDKTININYESTTWGTAEFKNVEYSEENKVYSFSSKDGVILMAERGGTPKEYAAEIVATITSTSDFEFTITAPTVMAGTEIIIRPGISPSQQALIEAVTGEYTDVYAGIVNAGTVTSAAVADKGTKVEITYSDGKFYLTAPELVYNGNTLPALTFPIEVASKRGEEGVYTLTQSSYEGSTTVNGAEKTFTITDFSGTIDNGNLTFTGSEKYGSMPFPLTMTYPYSE